MQGSESSCPVLADNSHPSSSDTCEVRDDYRRDLGPIFWDDQNQYWVVTGYAETLVLLKDDRFSSRVFLYDISQLPEDIQSQLKEPLQIVSQMVSFLDRPEHSRIRKLLAKEFSLRTLETKRQQIRQIIHHYLKPVFERGDLNAMDDIAFPMAVSIFLHLFGIPQEDHALFMQWAEDLHHFMYPLYPHFKQLSMSEPEELEHILSLAQRVTACIEYFRQLIRSSDDSSCEDWLQVLRAAREQSDAYTEDELLSMCIQLLDGGIPTTAFTIRNCLDSLLHHPDQLQLLHVHSDFLQQAIHELLRYDDKLAPQTYRRVLIDMDFYGQEMKAGEIIIARLGAANHDPACFADPDRLDILRTPQRHVNLGYGAHYCLGAYLTQIEMEIVLPLFVDYFAARK